MKVHVRTNDTVIVISGDDKGKKGKVLQVSPKEGKVIVEGVNLVKKHVKPRNNQEAASWTQKRRCMPPRSSFTAASAVRRQEPLTRWTATKRSVSAPNAAPHSNAEV